MFPFCVSESVKIGTTYPLFCYENSSITVFTKIGAPHNEIDSFNTSHAIKRSLILDRTQRSIIKVFSRYKEYFGIS